jgi:hypothetical protein
VELTVESILGWVMLAIGALQVGMALRQHPAIRANLVFVGVLSMSLGASSLLRHRGAALHLGSMAVVTVLVVVSSAMRRRESPRTFVVLSSIMVLAFGGSVLDTLGYLENVPVWLQAAILLPLIAAGLIWAIVTLARAFRAPFRPINQRED